MSRKVLLIIISVLVVIIIVSIFTGIVMGAVNKGGGGSKLFKENTVSDKISLNPESLDTLIVKTGAVKVFFHFTDSEPYVDYSITTRGLFFRQQGVSVERLGKTTTVATLRTGFFIGTIKGTIDIWCPEETIENLEIKLSAGEAEAPDLKLKSLDCSVSAGLVRMGKITADNVQVKMSAGKSSFDAIEADDIKLSVSAGEIDVKAGKAETLKAKLSAGNIDISGRFRDVDISVSAGDIKVENEIMPNRLSCSLSAGSVRLSMPESERGFTLNYNNSAGSVESEFPLTGNLIDRKGTVKYARGESDFTVKVSAGKFRLEKKQMSNHES